VAKVELKKRWGTLRKLFSSKGRLEKIVFDILKDFKHEASPEHRGRQCHAWWPAAFTRPASSMNCSSRPGLHRMRHRDQL
jgi:hypothetical protein